jgi:hypothetical protein
MGGCVRANLDGMSAKGESAGARRSHRVEGSGELVLRYSSPLMHVVSWLVAPSLSESGTDDNM